MVRFGCDCSKLDCHDVLQRIVLIACSPLDLNRKSKFGELVGLCSVRICPCLLSERVEEAKGS